MRAFIMLHAPLWITEKLEPFWRRRDYLKWVRETNWNPQVGDKVEDCRYLIQKIVWQNPDDPDEVKLEDGSFCSLRNCCHPVENN